MFRVAIVAVLVAMAGGRMAAAPSGELSLILGSLAERTQQYYNRFISIICTETVHQQHQGGEHGQIPRHRGR